jgi:DNA-directed RNA polymerase specialized sigma24 family protein
MPLDNEAEILRRAKAGDKPARDKIAVRYFEQAKRACRKHASDKGLDRDDADSAAYPAILKAIDSYDGHVPFEPWISVCARGVITEVDREFERQSQPRCGRKLKPLPAGTRLPPDEPPRRDLTAADKEGQREANVAARIDSLRGTYLRSWLNQRKGVDPINQKIARLLWVTCAPMEIGALVRTHTQAEVAAKLKMSVAAVSKRRAAIIKELTGKSEAELFPSPKTRIVV